MKKPTRLILFFLLGSFSCFAQSGPSKPNFRLLVLSTDLVWDLCYDLNGKSVPLLISGTQLSAPYDAPASGSLLLYKIVPAPVDPKSSPTTPAKTIKQPMAQVTLEAASHSLVLLAPSPAGSPLPYIARCLNDSLKSQPKNVLRVLNLAKRNVALKFDASTVEIPPGEIRQISYSTERGWVELQLAVASSGNQWIPLMNTTHPVIKDTRIFALAFDDPATAGDQQLIQLRFIPDVNPPPEDTPRK